MSEAEVTSRLDSTKSHFVTVVGRKGSGKSLLCHRLFVSYPYDKAVVDFHNDTAQPGVSHVEASELSSPPPMRFPRPLHDEPVTLRYVPDPASPTYGDDLDRVVGLCYAHRRTLLWLDEIGELTQANRTPPHLRRALHLGRHRQLSLLMAGPRPAHVDPLVLSQADYVYVFALPNPNDRRRVADTIGWGPTELDAAVAGLPEHGYLRYDARAHELVEFPPLPLRQRAA